MSFPYLDSSRILFPIGWNERLAAPHMAFLMQFLQQNVIISAVDCVPHTLKLFFFYSLIIYTNTLIDLLAFLCESGLVSNVTGCVILLPICLGFFLQANITLRKGTCCDQCYHADILKGGTEKEIF